jgi:hypothetical protein
MYRAVIFPDLPHLEVTGTGSFLLDPFPIAFCLQLGELPLRYTEVLASMEENKVLTADGAVVAGIDKSLNQRLLVRLGIVFFMSQKLYRNTSESPAF